MSKDKPIIIQEPQKLRKDLHKIIDKTYKLGYNQALKDAKKKCNECKEDFILIAKDWEKDYKKLNENTNIQLKQYRRMLNEYGKRIREFKEEKIEGLKKK